MIMTKVLHHHHYVNEPNSKPVVTPQPKLPVVQVRKFAMYSFNNEQGLESIFKALPLV